MNSLLRRSLISLVARVTINKEISKTTFQNFSNQSIILCSTKVNLQPHNHIYCTIRNKSKKKVDADDDLFDDDASLLKDSKVVKFKATSLRTDMVLKSTLGIARNKIEQKFYESKIRINGKKILKKSISVKEGDEIDIIKSVSPKNPDHLYVSRVEILNLAADDESIAVTARRFKSLLIENYESDPYKGNSSGS